MIFANGPHIQGFRQLFIAMDGEINQKSTKSSVSFTQQRTFDAVQISQSSFHGRSTYRFGDDMSLFGSAKMQNPRIAEITNGKQHASVIIQNITGQKLK